MAHPPPLRRHPVLWQLDARTTVTAVGGAGATLDAIDDDQLDRLVPTGVDWLYLLGVWQTGGAGREVSRTDPAIRASCEEALPDLTERDICGSCFAVTGYLVHRGLGGEPALARLRERLARRGVRLMLDFVPNHTALDHPWVATHPERYVEGTEQDLVDAPENWVRLPSGGAERVLAHGRDPYFAGWPDTLQLDYANPSVRAAMTQELLAASARCDGLRCDMAMLLLPDVFERTWGRVPAPFWGDAIRRVRRERPDFWFMAEVYWDREDDLQQEGFDATYDKRLYDRLEQDLPAVRSHLGADADFQARSARFLENHDEPRAAAVFGVGDRHRAAALTTYLVPGVRFFQAGQREARRVRAPVHLCRAPVEHDRGEVRDFYDQLLAVLAGDPAVHDGEWTLLEVHEAWSGNASATDLLASAWSTPGGRLTHLVVVNLSDSPSQGYVQLPHPELRGRSWSLTDLVGTETYRRDGDDLVDRGLYVDQGAWGHNLFAVSAAT